MRIYGESKPDGPRRWVVEVTREEMARSTHNHKLFLDLMSQGEPLQQLFALEILAEGLDINRDPDSKTSGKK